MKETDSQRLFGIMNTLPWKVFLFEDTGLLRPQRKTQHVIFPVDEGIYFVFDNYFEDFYIHFVVLFEVIPCAS